MSHWANSYVGAKWKALSVGEDGCYDCWGLVRHVYKNRYGVELGVVAGAYNEGVIKGLFKSTLKRYKWSNVRIDNAEEGDLVLLSAGSRSVHVGVLIIDYGVKRVLHCEEKSGVIISAYNDLGYEGWEKRKIFRIVKH